MSVQFDAQSATPTLGAGVTTLTDSTNLTVGTNPNRALIVEICFSGTPASITVTWDGVSMTPLGVISNSFNNTTALFGLRNPNSGTKTLTANWSNTEDAIMSASSFYNVTQVSDAAAFANVTTNTGATSPASVTVPSSIQDQVVAAFTLDSFTVTFTAVNNTQQFRTQSNSIAGASNRAIGAASTSMTATESVNNTWSAIGVDIVSSNDTQLRAANFTKPVPRVFNIPLQAYNVSLLTPTTTQNPFYLEDFSSSRVVPNFAAPTQYPNLVLENFSTPFFTQDFSKPFVPAPVKLDPPPYNINIFTNPIPFAQYDWSKTDQINGFAAVNYPNITLALTIDVTILRVALVAGRQPTRPPLRSIQNHLPNIVLGIGSPFYTQDWSKPFVPNPSKSVDYPNIALLNPAAPFTPYDFSKPSAYLSAIPLLQQYNPNLYTVVGTPFYTQDFSKPFVPTPAKPDQQSVNLQLFTNPIPFGPYDWTKLWPIKPIVSDQNNLTNINIFTNPIPFGPFDWSKPFFAGPAKPDQSYLNINLFTNPIPFGPFDFNKQFVPSNIEPTLYPNLALTTVAVTAPFYTQDFTKPFVPTPAKQDQQSVNLQLFTNPIPFAQYNWSKPNQPPLPIAVSSNFNPNLPPTGSPFIPIDWSRPFLMTAVPQVAVPNITINIGVPFNQFVWTKASAQTLTVPTVLPNLALNIGGSGVPFAQYSWPAPNAVTHGFVDASRGTNTNLFTNPIPFVQYSWPPVTPVKFVSFVVPFNNNLYQPASSATSLHIVKFIGNVGHFLLR